MAKLYAFDENVISKGGENTGKLARSISRIKTENLNKGDKVMKKRICLSLLLLIIVSAIPSAASWDTVCFNRWINCLQGCRNRHAVDQCYDTCDTNYDACEAASDGGYCPLAGPTCPIPYFMAH